MNARKRLVGDHTSRRRQLIASLLLLIATTVHVIILNSFEAPYRRNFFATWETLLAPPSISKDFGGDYRSRRINPITTIDHLIDSINHTSSTYYTLGDRLVEHFEYHKGPYIADHRDEGEIASDIPSMNRKNITYSNHLMSMDINSSTITPVQLYVTTWAGDADLFNVTKPFESSTISQIYQLSPEDPLGPFSGYISTSQDPAQIETKNEIISLVHRLHSVLLFFKVDAYALDNADCLCYDWHVRQFYDFRIRGSISMKTEAESQLCRRVVNLPWHRRGAFSYRLMVCYVCIVLFALLSQCFHMQDIHERVRIYRQAQKNAQRIRKTMIEYLRLRQNKTTGNVGETRSTKTRRGPWEESVNMCTQGITLGNRVATLGCNDGHNDVSNGTGTGDKDDGMNKHDRNNKSTEIRHGHFHGVVGKSSATPGCGGCTEINENSEPNSQYGGGANESEQGHFPPVLLDCDFQGIDIDYELELIRMNNTPKRNRKNDNEDCSEREEDGEHSSSKSEGKGGCESEGDGVVDLAHRAISFMSFRSNKSISFEELTWAHKCHFLVHTWFVLTTLCNVCNVISAIFGVRVLLYHEGLDPTLRLLFAGLACMLSWVELVQYVQHNTVFYVLILTLRKATPRLLRFLVGILPIFIGFDLFGVVFFAPYTDYFADMSNGAITLFALLNGDVIHDVFDQLCVFHPLIACVYLFTFISLFMYIVLNIIIATITDAFFAIKAFGLNTESTFYDDADKDEDEINGLILNQVIYDYVSLNLPRTPTCQSPRSSSVASSRSSQSPTPTLNNSTHHHVHGNGNRGVHDEINNDDNVGNIIDNNHNMHQSNNTYDAEHADNSHANYTYGSIQYK